MHAQFGKTKVKRSIYKRQVGISGTNSPYFKAHGGDDTKFISWRTCFSFWVSGEWLIWSVGTFSVRNRLSHERRNHKACSTSDSVFWFGCKVSICQVWAQCRRKCCSCGKVRRLVRMLEEDILYVQKYLPGLPGVTCKSDLNCVLNQHCYNHKTC